MRSDFLRNVAAATSRRSFLRTASVAVMASGVAELIRRPAVAETKLAARIAETPESHPLLPALKSTAQSLKELEAVKDYQATFVRQELVARRLLSSRMELKVRHEPFSVYLKYLEPYAGREVIYVSGKNDGKLQAHDTGLAGLVGTLSLDPQGSMAMDGNRHPITMIGIRNIAEIVIEQCLTLIHKEGVKVNFYPSAKIGDLPCKTYETILAKPVDGIEFQTSRIYFDAKTGLPVRAQALGFPDRAADKAPVIEDYSYLDLKTNVDLKDIDFDVENPQYAF